MLYVKHVSPGIEVIYLLSTNRQSDATCMTNVARDKPIWPVLEGSSEIRCLLPPCFNFNTPVRGTTVRCDKVDADSMSSSSTVMDLSGGIFYESFEEVINSNSLSNTSVHSNILDITWMWRPP